MWPAPYRIDAHVPSNSATVVWGYLPAGRPPVLTIRSGQTVKIDTVSHQGLLSGMDPVKFFGAAGIAPNEVLPDASEIYAKAPRPKNAGVHVLTGPIFVEGAEPGDMLEVRMLDFQFRVPLRSEQQQQGHWRAARRAREAVPEGDPLRPRAPRRALLRAGIEVPLVPFMGIMAVMPPDPLANTRPPGHLRRQHGFQPPHGRRAPLFARASTRRALLHGRLARGARRRRDQRHRDRGFAHAGPAVRRAQGRGRRDEMARAPRTPTITT